MEIDDDMIDVLYGRFPNKDTRIIDIQLMSHTSFFVSNANSHQPITNESPNETQNLTKPSQNQMLHSNWSAQMFRNGLENL